MKAQNKVNPENTESTIVKTSPVDETEKRTATTPAAKATKKNAPTWQNVLVGGVPGILLGALGVGLATSSAPAQAAETEGESENEAAADTAVDHTNFEVHEAHSVNDSMSFNEAFAAARAEVGPGGAFVWHGHVYGTYSTQDPEWQQMSVEDRNAHSNHIISQVHAGPYTPTENEPEIVPQTPGNQEEEPVNVEEQTSAGTETHDDAELQGTNDTEETEGNDAEDVQAEPVATDEDVESEVDVHIVGVETVQAEDGSEVQVGYGEVDGVSAAFIDTDGDGEVDTVLIDDNGNGEVDMDEVYDAEGSGITMEDLTAEAEANGAETLDDQLYSDMPDYTNDADMGDLA